MQKRWGSRRLQRYDYASPGEYFVTFCTDKRRCILGDVSSEGTCLLSEYGEICFGYASKINGKYPEYEVCASVVMPNHVHALIRVHPDREEGVSASVGQVIGWWKARTTKDVRDRGYEGALWQKSFHDHIVRDETDHARLVEYIANNPLRWQLDCLYERSQHKPSPRSVGHPL